MSVRKAIGVWLMLTWVAMAAAYGDPPVVDNRPDRMVDGEKLADRMAAWVKATFPDSRRTTEAFAIPQLEKKLHDGDGFAPASDPKRRALREWILAQPDRSLQPHSLIEKAIRLQNGNVQTALMLCWDVLREDWQSTDARNGTEITWRLADITGEHLNFDGNYFRDSSGGKPKHRETIRGDNFSAWYHFIGTTLDAYYNANRVSLMPRPVDTLLKIWLEEKMMYGSALVDPKKRIAIDRAGAWFGHRLARQLRSGPATAGETNGAGYLVHDPAFQDGWALKPGQVPADFGTDQKSKALLPGGKTTMERASEVRYRWNPERGGSSSAADLQSLAAAGSDPRPIVALEVVKALSARTDPESAALLELLMLHPSGRVGHAALRALVEVRKQVPSAAMIRLALTHTETELGKPLDPVFKDSRPKMLFQFFRDALAEVLPRTSIPATELLASDNPSLRQAGLKGLAHRADPASLELLFHIFRAKTSFESGNPSRKEVARAFPVGDPAAERLLASANVHREVLAALALCAGPPCREILKAVANNQDPFRKGKPLLDGDPAYLWVDTASALEFHPSPWAQEIRADLLRRKSQGSVAVRAADPAGSYYDGLAPYSDSAAAASLAASCFSLFPKILGYGR